MAWLDLILWQFAKDLMYSEAKIETVIDSTKQEIMKRYQTPFCEFCEENRFARK